MLTHENQCAIYISHAHDTNWHNQNTLWLNDNTKKIECMNSHFVFHQNSSNSSYRLREIPNALLHKTGLYSDRERKKGANDALSVAMMLRLFEDVLHINFYLFCSKIN